MGKPWLVGVFGVTFVFFCIKAVLVFPPLLRLINALRKKTVAWPGPKIQDYNTSLHPDNPSSGTSFIQLFPQFIRYALGSLAVTLVMGLFFVISFQQMDVHWISKAGYLLFLTLLTFTWGIANSQRTFYLIAQLDKSLTSNSSEENSRQSSSETYRNRNYGFEIDLPSEWAVCKGGLPIIPKILLTIRHRGSPEPEIEFSTGPNEYLNISIEKFNIVPSPHLLKSLFSQYAKQMNFTNCKYGDISVGQKEHIWMSYQMKNNIWSKKYMIILDNVGYAITASCVGKDMFLRREKVWDEIAETFRRTNM